MGLLDILFPKRCVGCNKLGSYFCQDCIANIIQGDLVCPVCEKPSIGGMVHPLCRRKYSLDGLWSLGVYQGSLKKAIQKLKYQFVTDLGSSLVDLTIEYWARNSAQFLSELGKSRGEGWVIVPVPLHKLRQNWRGFNQAALLGKLFAQKLGLDYQEVLVRTRNTKQQAKLSSYRRKLNIKGVFQVTKPATFYPPPSILLIDDVWTTGSTLKECAYVLKRAGFKKVWAITLAR